MRWSLQLCREFGELIPNARVEMIQKAGHLPQVEQRKVVSGHLEKISGGPGRLQAAASFDNLPVRARLFQRWRTNRDTA
jgi:hypothetical protein